jgi:hypothetical protein
VPGTANAVALILSRLDSTQKAKGTTFTEACNMSNLSH